MNRTAAFTLLLLLGCGVSSAKRSPVGKFSFKGEVPGVTGLSEFIARHPESKESSEGLPAKLVDYRIGPGNLTLAGLPVELVRYRFADEKLATIRVNVSVNSPHALYDDMVESFGPPDPGGTGSNKEVVWNVGNSRLVLRRTSPARLTYSDVKAEEIVEGLLKSNRDTRDAAAVQDLRDQVQP